MIYREVDRSVTTLRSAFIIQLFHFGHLFSLRRTIEIQYRIRWNPP